MGTSTPSAGILAKLSALAVLCLASAGLISPNSVSAITQQDSEHIDCVKQALATSIIHERTISDCATVQGKTLPANKAFSFSSAIEGKTVVYHVHNTCDTNEVIDETCCEIETNTVAKACLSIDGQFTSGSNNDGFIHWEVTVVGEEQDLPADSDLTRRDDGVICHPAGAHAVSSDELCAAYTEWCKTFGGHYLLPYKSEYVVSVINGSILELSIDNGNAVEWLIDEVVCNAEFEQVMKKCADNHNNFNYGSNTRDGLGFIAGVVYGGEIGAVASRAVTNATMCSPGNATVAVSEIKNIVETSMCPIFVNTSLSPQESYHFDYYVPEGNLVFKMLNICDEPVKLDNETCICGYEKVAETCTINGDRFVNGTVDSDCIRLSTWVNATRLTSGDGDGDGDGDDNDAADGDEVVKRASPNNCPAGATSPYPGDVTPDVDNAILSFCAFLSPLLTPSLVTVTRDINLSKWPTVGPVHFVYKNRCPASQLIDVHGCVDVLSGPVQSTYNACEFIAAEGASSTHICQKFTMLVGNL